jgi:Ca2+-binding EF-hand superfamily protein
MDNLQTEVLEIEFLRYSGGKETITYQDFAKSLLRFTSITEISDCLQQLDERITDKQPITFSEFRSFYYFLNNLEDFAIAMQLYALAGRSVGQGEFKRAVKVSTGEDLSDHLISTVYHLFDKDGDDKLSYVEFIGVMKDRIQRGFRTAHLIKGNKDTKTWMNVFSKCVKAELTDNL